MVTLFSQRGISSLSPWFPQKKEYSMRRTLYPTHFISTNGKSSGLSSLIRWIERLRELAPAVDWKAGGDRVERLRGVKDAGEVEQIRQAVAVAERAFAMFRAMLQ